MMPAPLDLDLDPPAEITERRSPSRIIDEWWQRLQATCPAPGACGCLATEEEIVASLGGEDAADVLHAYLRSVEPSDGVSADHGPAGAQ